MSRNTSLRSYEILSLVGWKSRFYLMSRNAHEGSLCIATKYCWKSGFYLMSRNGQISFFLFINRVGKAGFIWCHGTIKKQHRIFFILLEKPVLFDVTELGLIQLYIIPIYVGKAGFIWCHGTSSEIWYGNRIASWKSRFYLMSRNRNIPNRQWPKKLEKPVLFDVTEPNRCSRAALAWVGKAGFIWCHGTVIVKFFRRLIHCWKSRFYLMSRNPDLNRHKLGAHVGKAGFIWCHGTSFGMIPVSMTFSVGKAGFIWCHGTFYERNHNVLF